MLPMNTRKKNSRKAKITQSATVNNMACYSMTNSALLDKNVQEIWKSKRRKIISTKNMQKEERQIISQFLQKCNQQFRGQILHSLAVYNSSDYKLKHFRMIFFIAAAIVL